METNTLSLGRSSTAGAVQSTQNLIDLRCACEYRLLRRMLRAGGIESVVFGILAVYQGVSTVHTNPLAAALVLIGLLLISEGVWILSAPRPAGLIFEGLVFVAAGVWNLLISAAVGPGFLLFFALFQLVLGIQYFRRYSRFSILPGRKPSNAVLDRLDESIKRLVQARTPEWPDIIDFYSPVPWKAKLLPNYAMFATAGGRQVLVLGRDEVRLQEGMYDGKMVRASLHLGKQTLNCKISPRSISRLSAWISSTAS